jgi:pyridoxine/pyridoxamine 5'-phosphate oxidase
MGEHTPVVEQPLVEGQSATPWSEGRQRLETPERGRIYWLATVSPDGRPQGRPILGLWLDGGVSFITAETTRKARNLAADPRCAIASSSTAPPAVEVIVEGEAVKATDDATCGGWPTPSPRGCNGHWRSVTARWWARMPRPRGRLRTRCSS